MCADNELYTLLRRNPKSALYIYTRTQPDTRQCICIIQAIYELNRY